MDKEQAIEIIETHSDDISSSSLLGRALNMAIDALKAQLSSEGTTSDMVSRQEALDALRKCQTYLYDARDPELKIELSSAEAAINNLPPAQPEYRLDEWCMDCKEYDQEKHCCPRFNRVIREAAEEVRQNAQPEPAIPLSWIENEIKWLKSLDSTFSEITALQISAMVNKWRDEKK